MQSTCTEVTRLTHALSPFCITFVCQQAEEKNGVKSKTRILQLEILQKVEVLSPAPAGLQLTLPWISEAELKRAEHRNKGVAERALASIGQGVSVEAQMIFDALNKTYDGSGRTALIVWRQYLTLVWRYLLKDAV